ncbi:Pyrin Marenostrin [Channa argus]|uniref:Pyrin Marenostrin n=1 Tax=Channa argus TaxID=215402 RepID=A0A6G1PD50_CHAAH|nr:Pyrin Marenostrin [Channa argus]
MQVPELLLTSLEDLLEADFEKFKFYLAMNVFDGYKPIPTSFLEKATRLDTVKKMTKSYPEEWAVNITVEILKKVPNLDAAEKLQKAYAATKGLTVAAASTPAFTAPPTMSAQEGGVVIAPMISGSSCGSLNINFNSQ